MIRPKRRSTLTASSPVPSPASSKTPSVNLDPSAVTRLGEAVDAVVEGMGSAGATPPSATAVALQAVQDSYAHVRAGADDVSSGEPLTPETPEITESSALALSLALGELVPGWSEAADASGRVYYFCKASGETSWERPVIGGLEPGWKEEKDESGRMYYFHALRRETRWERPTAPGPAAGAQSSLASTEGGMLASTDVQVAEDARRWVGAGGEADGSAGAGREANGSAGAGRGTAGGAGVGGGAVDLANLTPLQRLRVLTTLPSSTPTAPRWAYARNKSDFSQFISVDGWQRQWNDQSSTYGLTIIGMHIHE